MSKLLIVDDDEVFARLLGRALHTRGYEVVIANSLDEAEPVLHQLVPDAVLLDAKLGDSNGLRLIQVIQEKGLSIRIVVLTSFGDPRNAAWAIRNGASEYLSKPADIDEIVRALKGGTETKEPPAGEFMSPDEARDTHILQFHALNEDNVSQTAQTLKMHRRTLQRILHRLLLSAPHHNRTKFGRVRRRIGLWSRWLNSNPA